MYCPSPASSSLNWRADRERNQSGTPIEGQRIPSWGRTNSGCANLSIGDIVHLPPKDKISPGSIVHKDELRTETFDHPVIVVGNVADSAWQVYIRPVTSLNSHALRDKYPCDEKQWEAHLLIQHPDNADGRFNNPNGSAPLSLEGDGKLQKPSYVRMDKCLRIEESELAWQLIQGRPAKNLRLDKTSRERVVRSTCEALYKERRQRHSWPESMAENTRRLSASMTPPSPTSSPPEVSSPRYSTGTHKLPLEKKMGQSEKQARMQQPWRRS